MTIYCTECRKDMSLLSIAENTSKGFSYKIYQCDHCDTLCKHDLWKNFGFTWLLTNGQIIEERE